MLEHEQDDQTPLAAVYDVHDSVSLVSDEMSLGSDENLDGQARNENSASANDKFPEIFGLYLNLGTTAQ